jgi:glycosyltransferase domain-containing protein|tara:strand:+ start:3044 stop:4144 length:1101 start_codon:yes stop_codon:yes gene_type:complete
MLDKITIVIPTYKRYPFLLRLLQFYSSYNLVIKFLILDSTPKYPKDKRLEKILSMKNIQWKRYDPDIFFVDKIARGCQSIQTDYAVLCADDDFIIPSTLRSCVEFLNTHQDYSSAHGLYFSHPNSDSLKNKSFTLWFSDGHSISDKSPIERLQAYLCRVDGKGYVPHYSVHRSNQFKLIWTETQNYVSDWGMSEIFPCCMSLIYGKMKVLREFYASREKNNYHFIDNVKVNNMFSKMKLETSIEGLTKHLTSKYNIELNKAELFLKDSLEVIIERVRNSYIDISANKYNNRIDDKNGSTLRIVRNFLRPRSRLKNLFNYYDNVYYKNCPRILRKDYFNDYLKVRDAVILARLTSDELNISRIDATS